MEYIKIMVTGNNESVIWDMANETEIASNHITFKYLSKEINVMDWKEKYFDHYKKWLNDEENHIYSITNPINMDMINAIISTNENTNDFKLYYWFDVDRDKYPNYIWKKCPISKSDLIALPIDFNKNNRKISPDYPLVFP